MSEEDRRFLLERNKALEDLRQVLASPHGRNLIKFLFGQLMVGEIPPVGIPDNLTNEMLGTIRAGKLLFDLVTAASPEIAASIFTTVIKERMENPK